MKTGIVIIGNEILRGQTLDTNSHYIADKLTKLGCTVTTIVVLPDSEKILNTNIRFILSNNDIVITTGGLGPTSDDITKKVLANLSNSKLVFSEKIFNGIRKKIGYDMFNRTVEIQKIQSTVIENAQIIENSPGLAPGFHLKFPDNKHLFAVPGVPKEMKYMMDNYIAPFINKNLITEKLNVSGVIKITGITESEIFAKVGDKLYGDLLTNIAFLPSYEGIQIRFSFPNTEKGNLEYKKLERIIYKELADYIYGSEETPLAKAIGKLLLDKQQKIVIAESCTSGYLGKLITDIPGSSAYFLGGYLVYSNNKKIEYLGIKKELIEEHGAVSEEVAIAMAKGTLEKNSDADIGIAITGIAGPSGGTKNKPVGTVYIAVGDNENITVNKYTFSGDRDTIRQKSSYKALQELWKFLK